MAESDPAVDADIIFDACCLFTIFGSQRPREILNALDTPSCVCLYVIDEEVIEIFSGPVGDERSARELISLQPLIDDGLIRVVELRSEEKPAFIRIAAEMDDGEARTLAIAEARGYARVFGGNR